jgi:hypothetical protein
MGKHIAVNFHTRLLDSFLQEWLQRKKDLADGVISKAEYMEWKVNCLFPLGESIPILIIYA